MNNIDAIIILSHLRVQNANIISSPLTWGFPSITSILGFAHALERKLRKADKGLKFGGVGIVCHRFEPQIKSSSYNKLFCLTRNPVKKDGSPPAIVQEGRGHIEISLVIQASGDAFKINESKQEQLAKEISAIAETLRLAGGSILPASKQLSKIITWPSDHDSQQKETKTILRRLLPGFALIVREDILATCTKKLQAENPDATTLDALLEYSSINYEPSTNDPEAEKAEWTIRKKPGWIVPIPVGFRAISELYEPGVVQNARDMNYLFRFVETIYSLGQWLSPHRIKDINDIFWSYSYDENQKLYHCINKNQGELL